MRKRVYYTDSRNNKHAGYVDEDEYYQQDEKYIWVFEDRSSRTGSTVLRDDIVRVFDNRGLRGMKKIIKASRGYFYREDDSLSDRARNIADELSDFLAAIGHIDDVDEYLDSYDLQALGDSTDALYHFSQAYFADNEDNL